MPNTMILIASSTVGSGGASFIDFSSIPNTYTDLCLKVSARSNSGGAVGSDGIKLEVNNSTTNFSRRLLLAYGTTTATGSGTDNYSGAALISSPGTTSTFGSTEFYFPNYTSSTNKSFSIDSVMANNSTTANEINLVANLWSQTDAINQLTLKTVSGSTFAQYTTAYLYGIVKS